MTFSKALKKVPPNHYSEQLSWQIMTGWPIKLYCKICLWGSSNVQYHVCPYGHGEMVDIREYALGDL
jgi:hypothetical protein